MKKDKLFFITAFAFLLRILLSSLPGFEVDITAWYAWADRLVDTGFGKFYHPNIWTHYTPGYLYILWVLGKIKEIFSLNNQTFILQLFKLPNNLADIITAVLIYKILKSKKSSLAIWGLVGYLFNPALIFNSSIWGQADSFLSFLILASFYLLIEKRRVFFSSLVSSLAFLVKPQVLFIFPVMFIFLIKNFSKKNVFSFLIIFLFTSLILSFLFFTHNPIFGLPQLILQMGTDYPYTTLGAFNFWQLFGNWQKDSFLFLNISKYHWGLIFFGLAELMILAYLWFQKKNKNQVFYFYIATALSMFNFFLFPTRIHERYLLYSLPFLLIAMGISQSLYLFFIYCLLSLFHFINLLFVYNYYYPENIKILSLLNISNWNLLPIIVSLLTIGCFICLLFYYWKNIFFLKSHKRK